MRFLYRSRFPHMGEMPCEKAQIFFIFVCIDLIQMFFCLLGY